MYKISDPCAENIVTPLYGYGIVVANLMGGGAPTRRTG